MTERAVWGDFEVDFDALLGRGGMGAVYRGRQLSLDREVAVKVLDTAGAPTEEMEQAFLQKFEIESRALARVHDSHIITVFQAGRNDGRCWYAMELIRGVTVEDRLGKKGMFDEAEAARIGLDVARALDAAHRAGIIHRDVKPGNIFLLEGGGTKLGDFGIARAAGAPPTPLTEASVIVGTPTYLSPEQGLGEECDHRADIYSLGVVLYEMLTERPPFTGIGAMETIYKHASEPPQPPRLLNPKISPSMEAVILRCLEKSPADRYPTYAELIDDLEAVASGRPLKHGEEPPAPSAPRRRKAWILAAAAPFAIAVLAFICLREGRPESEPPSAAATVEVEPPAPLPKDAPVPPPQPPAPEPPPTPLETLPSAPEPASPDLAASQRPRREESLANYMSDYAISADESALIRRLWALLERRDREIREHDYAGALRDLAAAKDDPKHTPYTILILDSHAERLTRVATMFEKTVERLNVGAPVDLRLASGVLVSGTVVSATAREIEVKPAEGSAVRVARAEISEETFCAGAAPLDRILYRAVHADPKGALAALQEGIRQAEEPQLLPHLPGLIQAICLRATDALERREWAAAKGVLKDLEQLRKLLPANLHYALEPQADLTYELRAAELLAGGDCGAVLAAFERSRAYPRAAARALSDFRSRPLSNTVAGAQWFLWEPSPRQDKAAYHDVKTGAFVVKSAEKPQAIRRTFERAGEGSSVFFAFEPDAAAASSAWAVAFSRPTPETHVQVEGARTWLTLRRVHDTDSSKDVLVGSVDIGEVPRSCTLTFVPVGGVVLVYFSDRLAFKIAAKEAPLSNTIEIGVSRGQLRISAVETLDSLEDE